MKPPRNRENTITQYRLTEEHLVGEALELQPAVHVILCLGGPDDENYDGVLLMLDVLLSHEISEAKKCRILQDDNDIQMMRTMESEVSAMCNLSKGVMEKS